MLPVLIGEAPSKSGDRYHRFPLSGAVAERMCRLGRIAPQEEGTRYGRWTWALYDHFDCYNVFERYAQATPWSAVRARDRVEELRFESATSLPRASSWGSGERFRQLLECRSTSTSTSGPGAR